jgi:hypothetical protein
MAGRLSVEGTAHLDPQNIEARHLFATLHLRLGSRHCEASLESLANGRLADSYWLAESLLREYLAAGPRCVPFLEQLAHVHQEKGDEMAAVAELGKAIEILRDDPDADNPQKAAQLYAKIRELAPASSVAFQLAPLFDVQTGEFLGGPSTSSATIPDSDAGFHEPVLSPETDYPLPSLTPAADVCFGRRPTSGLASNGRRAIGGTAVGFSNLFHHLRLRQRSFNQRRRFQNRRLDRNQPREASFAYIATGGVLRPSSDTRFPDDFE